MYVGKEIQTVPGVGGRQFQRSCLAQEIQYDSRIVLSVRSSAFPSYCASDACTPVNAAPMKSGRKEHMSILLEHLNAIMSFLYYQVR